MENAVHAVTIRTCEGKEQTQRVLGWCVFLSILVQLNHPDEVGKMASEAIEENARTDNESHQEGRVFVEENGHPCPQSRLGTFLSVLIARLLVCVERRRLRAAFGSKR